MTLQVKQCSNNPVIHEIMIHYPPIDMMTNNSNNKQQKNVSARTRFTGNQVMISITIIIRFNSVILLALLFSPAHLL